MEDEVTTVPLQKKETHKLTLVLSVLLALALLGCAVLGYLLLRQSDETARLQTTIDTNTREIETLKAETKDTGKRTDDTSAAAMDHPEDDSTVIITTVGAYSHSRVSDEHAKLSIKVTKKELPFARVAVSGDEGTGYACVLKKSDDIWIVLFCGQGAPLKSDLDQWGVPDSIIAGS